MRHVVVTGASRGIGLEWVTQLVARGDRVTACCRDPAGASALRALASTAPARSSVLALNVDDPASIAALPAAVGPDPVDVLINNAGILLEDGGWGSVAPEPLLASFRTNAMGPLLITQALTAHLQRGTAPVVMNVTSALGSIASRDSFYRPAYGMSKAALNMATVQMAHALRSSGIAVVCVHPGWVQTDMGGTRAPLDVVTSVRGLMGVLDSATLASSGNFFAWDGSALPW